MSAPRLLWQTEAGWRRYGPVREVLACHELGEVRPALARLEAAVAAGAEAFGYVSYEAAPAFDPALVCRPPDGTPLLWFALCDGWSPADDALAGPADDVALTPWQPDVDRPRYDAAIAAIHEAIAAGETYQVNYTWRLQADFAGDPLCLLRRMDRAQGGGFGALLETGDLTIVSASPELFFERRDGRLTCRPMKGTAARGRWAAEDRDHAAWLAADPKNRAENLMIVDMLRNDLGRLAETGSVQVPALFAVEQYEQVWQMTSTITAESSAGFVDLFGALFPCASITGAPKVQTMGLIAGLETSPRGVYCGAIGSLSPGGEARFSVAIRTVAITPDGRATFGVGGGIVWDSTAESEWQECLTKALVLTRPRPAYDLFETLLWQPGEGYWLLDRHLDRLADSAASLGFAHNPAAVREALTPTWPSTPHRVRLTLARDGAITVTAAPFTPRPADAPPFRLALAATPVDSADRLLYHKTTNRARYDEAKAAHPEADEVLLHNERGELTEGTFTTLIIQRDGRRLTPALACGLLPGTLRAELLATGTVTEALLTPADLATAEAIWVVNSLRGWIPARLVEAATESL